jgi:hypothetical protein
MLHAMVKHFYDAMENTYVLQQHTLLPLNSGKGMNLPALSCITFLDVYRIGVAKLSTL